MTPSYVKVISFLLRFCVNGLQHHMHIIQTHHEGTHECGFLQIIQFDDYKAGLLLLTKSIKKDYLQK